MVSLHHLVKSVMRVLIFLIYILISFSVCSQEQVYSIEIYDKQTSESIQNVSSTFIFQNGTSAIRTSNQKGFLRIVSPNAQEFKITFTHPLYDTREVQVSASSIKDDTIYNRFYLIPSKVQHITEMVVKPVGVPYKVFGSERVSVADYEVLPSGKLLLLAYPKRLKKGSELLIADGFNVETSFAVPGVAEELVRDFRGNSHILCKDNVFGVYLTKTNVQIANIEKDYFVKYVMPILDTNKSKLYFSNFNPDYPAFEYYAFDQLDSSYTKIANIKDDLMMELYRSEYKWVDVRTKLWARYKEQETGIDAEIWVGANYFTQSVYYKELYAPMFERNDSLFVFDYYSDKLYTYDFLGNPLDSVAIYHHYKPKSTGWKKHLVQDNVTGQVYAHFEKDGNNFVGLIDLQTGEIKERVKLEYRYVENISVHDNFVYYIYREFETAQKKYLFREKLPYSFGKSVVPIGDEFTEK